MPGRAASIQTQVHVTILLSAPANCPNEHLPASERKDAGYPGITTEKCYENGGCWDTSCGVCIWCYKPPAKPAVKGKVLKFQFSTDFLGYLGYFVTSLHWRRRPEYLANAVQTFNSFTGRPDVRQCLIVQTPL